jgi:hypothetical protein
VDQQGRQVQADAERRVRHQAAQAGSRRMRRLAGGQAGAHAWLQDAKWRGHAHEARQQGRRERRPLHPLLSRQRQQHGRKQHADRIVKRPAQDRLIAHGRRLGDVDVAQGAARQMTEPAPTMAKFSEGMHQKRFNATAHMSITAVAPTPIASASSQSICIVLLITFN